MWHPTHALQTRPRLPFPVLVYNGTTLTGTQQDTLSKDNLVLLCVANYCAANAAGWTERDLEIMASPAFLLGALEHNVTNPDVTVLSQAEQNFLTKFEDIQGFFQGGWGGAFAPPWLCLAPSWKFFESESI